MATPLAPIPPMSADRHELPHVVPAVELELQHTVVVVVPSLAEAGFVPEPVEQRAARSHDELTDAARAIERNGCIDWRAALVGVMVPGDREDACGPCGAPRWIRSTC